MKIIRLTASNVKRLRAVEITPEGNLVTITGRNAQGKTSVLDAIWLALGGGSASRETARPIRDGADHASVTLDLGDLTVTRTWTGAKTALTVKSADGAKYSSPQTMLDALVGRLSFDPLEFTRLTAREQTEALLDLVDLDVDLDILAKQRQALYDQRTEIGRQRKAIGDVTADESLPTEEISATAILAQIREAQEVERRNAEVERRRQQAADEIAHIETRIAEWQRKLVDAQVGYQRVDAEWQALVAPAETADLEAQLATIEDTNAKVRANNAAREKASRRAELREQYEILTDRIDSLDETKAEALAKAEFPVAGLGFDDHGVTYNGVPFSQASSAEQIRVSLAMAMSLNPKLRVIRILDGSLLDADSLALITAQAAEADYQVWIERVEDASASAVVIEDGQVAS